MNEDMVDQVLEERDSEPAKVKLDFYEPEDTDMPMMPVEFAVAAYRFGHSMIRGAYRINDKVDPVTGELLLDPVTGQPIPNVAAIFGAQLDASNLNGSRPIPRTLEIVWRHFFAIPTLNNTPTNNARLIDSKLSAPLFTLPSSVVPPPDPPGLAGSAQSAARQEARSALGSADSTGDGCGSPLEPAARARQRIGLET